MNIYGVTIPAEAVTALRRAMADLAGLAVHSYPWAGLVSGFRLVGYGSLLNPTSAARTLTASAEDRLPVIALGVRRVFDYEMPASAFANYGMPLEPRVRAALNVRFTGELADAVNGMLCNISASDVEALRKREVGYDLAPVVCLPWGQLETPPFVAHILTCRQRLAGATQQSDALLPHPFYYGVCRAGAAAVSEAFLRFFLDSTFLADGITAAAAWERQAL